MLFFFLFDIMSTVSLTVFLQEVTGLKTAAVIAEFNPFHKGHEYLLSEIKKLSHADNIIVIMSGDYVQRGEPAIWDKFMRAKTALMGGANLVLELPAPISTGSAAVFAEGAVRILNSLNIIDELWFGSEYGDILPFDTISDILLNEPKDFSDALKKHLKSGVSFPKARSLALDEILKPSDHAAASYDILSQPNNILGLEYLIALKKLGSQIKPCTLKRKGPSYNDIIISDNEGSASAIRNAVFSDRLNEAIDALPKSIYSSYDDHTLRKNALSADDFSLLLHFRLLTETVDSLCTYPDISPDLARRIKQHENSFRGFNDFAMLLKAKNLTYTHIKRCLLHIVLGIHKHDVEAAFNYGYVRMLGFRDAKELLNGIKKSSLVTLCGKPSVLPQDAYAKELFVSNLYNTVLSDRTGNEFVHEYKKEIIRLSF